MKHKKKSGLEIKDPKTQAGYGAQDFDQGRAGSQSGHSMQPEGFGQFQNAGKPGYAAEKTANSAGIVKKDSR
ncbi:MAG: hypothetical protein EOO13_11740 [Chitinophagaceae bacterium]|nr:MAG: hypothetical protein EOO13_11740 [Chitinophagaceae bacterium]